MCLALGSRVDALRLPTHVVRTRGTARQRVRRKEKLTLAAAAVAHTAGPYTSEKINEGFVDLDMMCRSLLARHVESNLWGKRPSHLTLHHSHAHARASRIVAPSLARLLSSRPHQ
jgi:hypothetical protein